MLMDGAEKQSKMGVLEDLIKYMRKLELAKDEPEDPLKDGLGMVEDKMKDKAERELGDETDMEDPSVEVEIEGKPMAEEDSMDDEDKLSPFEQKMKDYFNDTDRPKVGNSMAFMVASKKPMGKMDEMDMAMSKKKRGRPFKR